VIQKIKTKGKKRKTKKTKEDDERRHKKRTKPKKDIEVDKGTTEDGSKVVEILISTEIDDHVEVPEILSSSSSEHN